MDSHRVDELFGIDPSVVYRMTHGSFTYSNVASIEPGTTTSPGIFTCGGVRSLA